MVTTHLIRTNGIIAGTESHSELAYVFSYQAGDSLAPVQLRPPGKRLRCLGHHLHDKTACSWSHGASKTETTVWGCSSGAGQLVGAHKASDSISMEHTGRNGICNLHRLPQPEENTMAMAMEVTWQFSALNGPRLGPPWMILPLDEK